MRRGEPRRLEPVSPVARSERVYRDRAETPNEQRSRQRDGRPVLRGRNDGRGMGECAGSGATAKCGLGGPLPRRRTRNERRGAAAGVSLQVYSGSALRAATSTDLDGRYTIFFAPNAGYKLVAELPAFTGVEREVTLAAPPCDITVNLQLSLRPRADSVTTPSAAFVSPPAAPPTGGPVSSGAVGGFGGERAVGDQSGSGGRRAGGRGGIDRGRGGRGTQPAAGDVGARFQPLTVDASSNAAETFESTPADASADIARLLPPGFSLESAQADAIAINGNNNATNLDRGALSDRAQAIRLGRIDPEQFAAGLAAAFGGPPFGDAGDGGRGGLRGRGGFPAGGSPAGGPGPGRARRPWWAGRTRGNRGHSRLRACGTRGARAESLSGVSHLHLRRIGARHSAVPTAAGCAGVAAAIHEEQLRRHHRRSAQDSRSLCRHESANQFSNQLHR